MFKSQNPVGIYPHVRVSYVIQIVFRFSMWLMKHPDTFFKFLCFHWFASRWHPRFLKGLWLLSELSDLILCLCLFDSIVFYYWDYDMLECYFEGFQSFSFLLWFKSFLAVLCSCFAICSSNWLLLLYMKVIYFYTWFWIPHWIPKWQARETTLAFISQAQG